jgi:hypothetical protein
LKRAISRCRSSHPKAPPLVRVIHGFGPFDEQVRERLKDRAIYAN